MVKSHKTDTGPLWCITNIIVYIDINYRLNLRRVCDINRVESSASKNGSQFSIDNGKSSIKGKNNKGPRIDENNQKNAERIRPTKMRSPASRAHIHRPSETSWGPCPRTSQKAYASCLVVIPLGKFIAMCLCPPKTDGLTALVIVIWRCRDTTVFPLLWRFDRCFHSFTTKLPIFSNPFFRPNFLPKIWKNPSNSSSKHLLKHCPDNRFS